MADIGKHRASISIIGLPGSGKTTFLAALWELVNERRVTKLLAFDSIGDNDHTYLRRIVTVWRRATEQARTSLTGLSAVKMNLKDSAGKVVEIAVPDAPGEDFRAMWEDRELGRVLGDSLADGNIMLLLNGDKVKAPAWVTERAAQRKATGKQKAETLPRDWHPSLAPTQVQLVDLLQLISHAPVGPSGRKIVVMISAWDKVEGERLTPDAFLRQKLPLLAQYLEAARDNWTAQVYGVSAQGGEYDGNEANAQPLDAESPKKKGKNGRDAERLREVDIAANRIRLVFGERESNDLTEPLRWLMQ
ncbi:TRAFAC clade GTPase domain-containing protein [Xanthomonas sacchari]|uniref:TRAFAC clade GTPase domain-containing protein n=1 Tax=Xanthomonas sacchari TaxID=56458 RepID=UPI003529C22E